MIETPWTSYRKILVNFTTYLQLSGREKAFKSFCYGTVPAKHWDIEIEDWLMKLEQSEILSVNHLEILSSFLQCFNDSQVILTMITEFQSLLYLVKMISRANGLHGKVFFKIPSLSTSSPFLSRGTLYR